MVVKEYFSYTMHSHGKVCIFIIDDDNFENVMSTQMVERLCLKIEPHPHLYKLSWLQKENEVKVSKCYLVSFSIGNSYKDEAWCHAFPMDACHLLLGRSWKYDRRTLHDGYRNTHLCQRWSQELL